MDIVKNVISRGRPVAAIAGALLVLFPTLAGAEASAVGQWRVLLKVPGIVDVVGPRADGRLVLATRTGLFLLRPGGAAQPFANGPGGYTASGGEPYIALAYGSRVWGVKGCSFERGDVFALDADSTPGIVRVRASGKASRLVDFPSGAFPSGITFDPYGRYGYRLLVTANFENNTKTTLYAIDCLGRLSVIVEGGPHVEGGIVVAPKSFGRFGGRLLAPDEATGLIHAFNRDGTVELVVDPGLPAGGDIGVESLGFVPPRVGKGAAVYFADLGAPGAPTEGTDALLVLRGQDLTSTAVRPGELLAATEGGGTTIAVRCAATCTVRRVAEGLSTTHGEGHLTFVAGTLPRP